VSKNLGRFTQFDLENPDDCMDLVALVAFTNAQIKEMRSKGIRFHSVNNDLLFDLGQLVPWECPRCGRGSGLVVFARPDSQIKCLCGHISRSDKKE
jgi:hypothetical protein